MADFIKRYAKYITTDSLHSNSLYLIGNVVLMSVLGFVFWLIVARFYSDAAVGLGAAVISASALLAVLCLVGLNFSVIFYLPKSPNPNRLINAYLTTPMLVSIGVVAVFLAGLHIWSPALLFLRTSPVFAILFFAIVISTAVFGQAESTMIAERQSKYVLFKNLIYSVVKIPILPIFAILALHSLGIVSAWAISVVISSAVALFIFVPKIRQRYRFKPVWDYGLMKEAWRYSGMSYASNLLAVAPVYILPLMVINQLGAEPNAHFYIAWMLATILFAIPTCVAYSLFAEGSAENSNLANLVRRAIKFASVLLAVGFTVFMLGGKQILGVFGEGYQDATWLLTLLTISAIPLTVNYIYTTVLRVTNRMRELVLVWAVMAIGALVGSQLFMPIAGISGIGYAWLITQGAVAGYIYAFRRQVFLPRSRIKDAI